MGDSFYAAPNPQGWGKPAGTPLSDAERRELKAQAETLARARDWLASWALATRGILGPAHTDARTEPSSGMDAEC